MASVRLIVSVILFCILNTSYQFSNPVVKSLNGYNWIVVNSNNSIKVPAKVPGGIYTDLKNANILRNDFFYRFNDLNYRWVSKDSWMYTTLFTVNDDLLKKENIWLVFHGLDTITRIIVNNVLIGVTDNMFVRYRFDIKPLIKNGANKLQVYILSPVIMSLNISNKYQKQFGYLVPPECTPPEQHGECHVNFLRKMAASFSWDWGPAFPSMGIWKNVEIEAFNSAIIRSVSINVIPKTKNWEVSGVVYLDTAPNKFINGTATIDIYMRFSSSNINQLTHSVMNIKTTADRYGDAIFNFSGIFVDKEQVKLWWPNGYGNQNLYTISLQVSVGNEVSSFSTKFGFRTVKLVQNRIDSMYPHKGLTFHFEINGIKVYAKGSNYIPAHILPELSYKKSIVTSLLKSAKDANMNMLRVWGGGLYESDLFYQLCDEMGIMIWQDMMFACNMYPVSNEFLQSVSEEVTQNVRRLQIHPSIVVWAGNNENEAALVGNWYGTSRNFEKYKQDYIELYVNTISKLVLANDITREYVVSSPSNGLESNKEGYIAYDPYSSKYGDVHVYQYYADNWDHSSVAPNRFCSEYGIQSLPSYSSLENVAENEDLNISSRFMEVRQHHGSGYSQMEFEIDLNLQGLKTNNLKQYIYFSQINQAMSIKTMTEKYRSLRDFITADGEGFNMGALYWQLNDVWQAPSWSSVEFNGKWKMLHYYAKNFFSPIVVIPTIKFDYVTVMVMSDLPGGPDIICELHLFIYTWQSFKPVSTVIHKIKIKPFSSVVLIDNKSYYEIIGDQRLCGNGSYKKRNCFLFFKLLSNGTQIAPDTYLFPERLTLIQNLKEAKIELKEIKALDIKEYDPFRPKKSKHFEITLITNTISLFVWLDVGNIRGIFSDNGFHMLAPERKVNFTSWQDVTPVDISESLNIMTYNGHYKGIARLEVINIR